MSQDSQSATEMAELERLYHSHKAEIWRYLVSLARDQDEAEDLMQGVFIKLIPRLRAGVLREAEARAYLYRTAYNLYVDSYRRKGSEGRALERIQENTARAVESRTPGREIHEIIDQVLASDRLSERRADILKLRLLGHYGLQEIADSVGVALSTVHRELQAGFTELREALKAVGINPRDYEG